MPVRQIDTEDLVGVREIAYECGVTRAAVVNWRTRHDAFPSPLVELASGPVFYWPQVYAWLVQTGRST